MKLTHQMAACSLFFLGLAPGLAQATQTACEQKAARIQNELTHALQAGHTMKAAGLETALTQVRRHCTDDELIKEKKQDIQDQEDDIKELKQELSEKQAEGRFDKVEKLERKIQREEQELEILRKELKSMEG